jgi:hypothetical protein
VDKEEVRSIDDVMVIVQERDSLKRFIVAMIVFGLGVLGGYMLSLHHTKTVAAHHREASYEAIDKRVQLLEGIMFKLPVLPKQQYTQKDVQKGGKKP